MAPKKQANEPKKKKATVDDKTVSIAPICVLLHTCFGGTVVPSVAKNEISLSVNHKTDVLSLIVWHEK